MRHSIRAARPRALRDRFLHAFSLVCGGSPTRKITIRRQAAACARPSPRLAGSCPPVSLAGSRCSLSGLNTGGKQEDAPTASARLYLFGACGQREGTSAGRDAPQGWNDAKVRNWVIAYNAPLTGPKTRPAFQGRNTDLTRRTLDLCRASSF